MAGTSSERTMLLLSIVPRGSGADLIALLDKRGIQFHFQCTGSGTASTEMMDLLGLGSSDKDIILSFAARSATLRLAEELSGHLKSTRRGGGILIMLAPSAINQLTAAIAARQAADVPTAEGSHPMKNEYRHSLILIAVDHGFTEEVMQTARKAGATGGTVIRARLVGAEKAEPFLGTALQTEREVVSILAPESVRDQILEDVNREYGLRSKAQGILCSLPVERAFKI